MLHLYFKRFIYDYYYLVEYEYHVKNSYIESNNENLIEALLRDDRTANHERLIKREQDYINERVNYNK